MSFNPNSCWGHEPGFARQLADMINQLFVELDVSKAYLDVGFLATGTANVGVGNGQQGIIWGFTETTKNI